MSEPTADHIPAEGERHVLRLPDEVIETLARGLSDGIHFSIDRSRSPEVITSVRLTAASPPNPLAEAIKAKVGDDVDMPLIIDGQWFIIRRTRPLPLT